MSRFYVTPAFFPQNTKTARHFSTPVFTDTKGFWRESPSCERPPIHLREDRTKASVTISLFINPVSLSSFFRRYWSERLFFPSRRSRVQNFATAAPASNERRECERHFLFWVMWFPSVSRGESWRRRCSLALGWPSGAKVTEGSRLQHRSLTSVFLLSQDRFTFCLSGAAQKSVIIIISFWKSVMYQMTEELYMSIYKCFHVCVNMLNV